MLGVKIFGPCVMAYTHTPNYRGDQRMVNVENHNEGYSQFIALERNLYAVKAVCSVACFEWIVWNKARTNNANGAQV